MKYKDLVSMWQSDRDSWRSYDFEVSNAIGAIFHGIKTQMEIADRLIKLVNPDDPDEKTEKTIYTPLGAMVKSNDGWTKFGFMLTLEISENTFPKASYKFIPKIKKQNQQWAVKLMGDNPAIEISTQIDTNDIAKVVVEIENVMRNMFEDRVVKWLKQGGVQS